ncbi:hypothetical protein [Herbaspirillum sp. YR522]|uniref:hypothetical protein n=1 Tax=Herbaspirillum sp. YR522 TaxID=1144342 RepID=UPI00058D9E0D|nr:hypothetical protein [Herbaspirillum sp. YR522]
MQERARFSAALERQPGVKVIGRDEAIDAVGFRPQHTELSSYPARVTNTGEGITASDGMSLCTSVLLTSTPADKSQRHNSIYHAPMWATRTPEVIQAHKQVYDAQGWQTKAVVFVGEVDRDQLEHQIREGDLSRAGWDDPFERRTAMADPALRKSIRDIEQRAAGRAEASISQAAEHTGNVLAALDREGIAVMKTIRGIPENAIFGAQSAPGLKDGKREMKLSIFSNGRLQG